MQIYCLKCKMKTDTDNIEQITRNNRQCVVGNCNICNTRKNMFIKYGTGVLDIHKMIGKLPRPSKGFVAPGGYRYLGPYNPLNKQIIYNKDTGEIYKINESPKNKLDEIAMHHDICYSVNPKNKHMCDKKMIENIDAMENKNLMAKITRGIINTKQQLGLGQKRGQKKNDTKIDINDDRKQYANEMHKRIIKKFKRRYIYSPGIDVIWTTDLILIPKYSKQNNGYKYILTILDVFSKFAWVAVTKKKDKKTIANAFENILKKGRVPRKIWSDGGGEYDNHFFRSMLKKYNIEPYRTDSELKAIMAERFNQTLMNKIVKMFTERDNHRYIDDIERIVNEYNNTYHSSIKMTPIEASKEENEGIVYYNLYSKRRREMMKQNIKPKFKVGDIVRIYKFKKIFEKGYDPKWSNELFIIYKDNGTIPNTYKVKSIEKKNDRYEYIKGNFYEQELQKTKMV